MAAGSPRRLSRLIVGASLLALLLLAVHPSASHVFATSAYCSSFVNDLSIPDGTHTSPGQNIHKGWRLRNCGSARWVGVRAMRTQGSFGPASIAVATTNAGATVDIWADFTAPSVAGQYQATYQLSGLIGNFGTPFWINIVDGSSAGAWCQCVAYIQNRFNLSTQHRVAYAKDMGSELQFNGFHAVGSPIPGAVIVFPANFGQGITGAGHVGVIQSVTNRSDGGYTIIVRGANQRNDTKSTFTDSGCTNVDLTGFTIIRANRGQVSYWTR